MKHYSEKTWLDFTRHLLPAEEMGHMQAHLDCGCDECSAVHRIWKTVWELAGREAAYQPDSTDVDLLKAAFSERRPNLAPAPRLRLATLVFDSFVTAGAMAGFRSISPTARHLLYVAGPLTIDLRLAAHGGTTMTLAGQVLEAGVHTRRAGSADVIVTRGETTLARTAANDFGEFQVDVEDGPDLQIRLEIDQHAPIVLPLPAHG
jgi:hypothetical protein